MSIEEKLAELEKRIVELEKYSHKPVVFVEDENGFLRVEK